MKSKLKIIEIIIWSIVAILLAVFLTFTLLDNKTKNIDFNFDEKGIYFHIGSCNFNKLE